MGGAVSIELDRAFVIDAAVRRVFANHPLVNAIMWEYFCDGERGRAVIEEAFFGPSERIVSVIQRRRRIPAGAPTQFWKLYQKWMAPSEKQISDWSLDLVHHIIDINRTYSKADEVIFTALPELVTAMGAEFPDARDGLQRASVKGFERAAEVYRGLLEGRQAARVVIIDPARPNRNDRFHVIHVCVRMLSNWTVDRRAEYRSNKSAAKGMLDRIENHQCTTAALQFYPLVGEPIHRSLPETGRVGINQQDIWNDPGMQSLVAYPDEFAEVRNEVQRIFMYSDVDPANGLDQAIHRMNTRIHKTEYSDTPYESVGSLHLERPMKDFPWRRENSEWDNGMISATNMDLLKPLLSRVPTSDQLGARPAMRYERDDSDEDSTDPLRDFMGPLAATRETFIVPKPLRVVKTCADFAKVGVAAALAAGAYFAFK